MTPADRNLLAADLKQAEGLRLEAYQDSVGVWTIGFGTNLQELTIPLSLAEQWLYEKMIQSETECYNAFPWWRVLDPVRQRAIVELHYNLGLTKLLLFVRTLAAIEAGDYETAARQLKASKWAKQVGPTRSGRIIAMVRTGVAGSGEDI